MIAAETPLNVTIRAMVLDDLPQVIAIDRASFSLPWPERSFRYELTQNPNALSWVAELGDAGQNPVIAGMIVTWLIIDEIHIGTIAIHPDYRRRGLAQKLLAHALLAGRARGASSAFLEVRRGNLAAQVLYQRFGFDVVGERRHYYHDNGEDALILGLNGLDTKRLQQFSGG
jgi:ribosomal-protein-alanine N-acetyltransferase